MFNFLKHKKEDSWVDTALRIAIRFMITGFSVVLGYLLAFAATMGPPIAPHIWNGDLDMVIRLGIIAVGFGSCAIAFIWFIWPGCRYIYRVVMRTK